jgi:flagellar biosynthetic protein FlhB
MADDQTDKTEDATPRRLQKEREAGNIPISREVGILVSLVALTLSLSIIGPGLVATMLRRLTVFLEQADKFDMSDHGVAAMRLAGQEGLAMALPVMVLAAVMGVGVMAIQSGFVFNPDRLIPDLARLDPRRGIKRLFGLNNLVELAKSMLKVLAAGLVCWRVLAAGLPVLAQSPSWDAGMVVTRMDQQVMQVLYAIVGLQAVISLADLGWVRYRYARDMRMSRFDVRQEQKDSDGDPRIKRRLRQIRMLRARRRMREGVRRATVVITNPTHYAVALRYDKNEGAAPVVTAKGVDSMAARIREAAGEFGVPLVSNPPLARALYQVNVDTQIPPEHYRAVAQVIAYVWRLRQRGSKAA